MSHRPHLALAAAVMLVLTVGPAAAQPHQPDARGGRHGGMGMGRGMGMGMGMGMGRGSASPAERQDIHALLSLHDSIRRTVTVLPDGIRTLTESDDPEVAAAIKRHVADMGRRLEQGKDPGLPVESPTLRSLFLVNDKIRSRYETTDKGVLVTQTSADPSVAAALQGHAAEVSDLARRGMVAAHEAMMKNHHSTSAAR